MQYGLIGEKLGHSFSKEIHNKIDNYDYQLNEVDEDNIEAFIKAKNFKGINVTIPYKQTVMPLLDEIDPVAKEIGAVNTIVNKDGKLFGYNTDYYGMQALIQKNKISVKDKKCLILGTGGTSNTAYTLLKNLGAKKIIKVSRTEKENCVTYKNVYEKCKDFEIILNTTPCGMYPDVNNCAVNVKSFKHLDAVIDVIYNPIRTDLVLDAQENGIKACGGLFMLVYQAIKAYELFFDKKVQKEKVDKIYEDILKEKINTVLIGMPSSGKTSIGKKISKVTKQTLVDTDKEITKKENQQIKDIFSTKGEDYFRKIEKEVVKENSLKNGIIIATGGGIILNNENIRNLKHNGIIYFIDRKLKKLVVADKRPLANSEEKIRKLYEERYNKYVNSCDVLIKNNENIMKVCEKILGEKIWNY